MDVGFLVVNRLGERLTDDHENWYINVVLHGEGSWRVFSVLSIPTGLFEKCKL